MDTRLFHRKHSFSKTAEEFSLWGKHLARPIQHDISHNVYPERRDSRCHDVLTLKEGYLTLSPGGGWETKRRVLVRGGLSTVIQNGHVCSFHSHASTLAQACARKWIHVYSTASTLFRKLLKSFLCGGNIWHGPYNMTYLTTCTPSGGTVDAMMYSPLRKDTSHSPPVGFVTGILPPTVTSSAKPVIQCAPHSCMRENSSLLGPSAGLLFDSTRST